MRLLFPVSLLILLASCTDTSHTLRDVSDYKIRKSSLENHASVRVVYVAGGPSKEAADLASGYQYLVKEQASGDTFRILCNQLYKIDFSRNYLYVSYFSTDSADFPVLENDLKSSEEPAVFNQFSAAKYGKRPAVEMPGRVYSSVADTALENRPFPTVFGTLQQFPGRPID
jgi:hypothetical protein